MKPTRIVQPFYKRLFYSLKSPRDFYWRTIRFHKHGCRKIYASTIAPMISGKSKGCVAMFHLGRSGSTVLGDLLDQHPDIFWDSEIFLNHYRRCLFSEQTGTVYDPFAVFKKQRRRCGRSYYGFESKTIDQNFMYCSVNEFILGLHARKVSKFILLKRHNLLRVAASSVLARKKQVFHVWKYEKPVFHTIQLAEFNDGKGRKIKLIDQLESWTQDLQELEKALKGYDLLELSYENDIQSNPIKALNKVTDFLDVPRVKNPIINLRQSTPFPLKDFVEDFDLVIDMLRGTSYEHMTREM